MSFLSRPFKATTSNLLNSGGGGGGGRKEGEGEMAARDFAASSLLERWLSRSHSQTVFWWSPPPPV